MQHGRPPARALLRLRAGGGGSQGCPCGVGAGERRSGRPRVFGGRRRRGVVAGWRLGLGGREKEQWPPLSEPAAGLG
nr:unnamed protein product [Digitaria exilis]